MKKIVLSITAILFLVSCGEDDIPTSDSSKKVDWSALQQTSKKMNSTDSDDMADNDYSKIDSPSQSNSESEYEEDQEIDPIPDFEDLKEKQQQAKKDELSQDEVENGDSDYSKYTKELESQMQQAIAHYPRPPTPANLSAYDSRGEDSYRAITTNESKGSGEFPPMPPIMKVNTN